MDQENDREAGEVEAWGRVALAMDRETVELAQLTLDYHNKFFAMRRAMKSATREDREAAALAKREADRVLAGAKRDAQVEFAALVRLASSGLGSALDSNLNKAPAVLADFRALASFKTPGDKAGDVAARVLADHEAAEDAEVAGEDSAE